ncbi:hypothetical protein BT96DRAFT_276809 [Gymnopus androsaceus JB14]|uniref:Uncharacterized protein n=1 Tax=Gymnopus androsaceus JB14 TaxID=1447944 RepID=A0A6A4H293_9AGAR|nr:hypothetical protein BT96DRAFT_276809 [Gymnopus androsaceus JB14]
MMSKHAQLSNAPASLRPVFYTDDHTGKTYTIHPRSPSDYHHRAQSYGKENYQAGHPQRGFSQTQMPQQNNSMLKQPFMYNPTGYNVSHSDPHAARVGGHVPQSHLMPRNAALNPIAQRYTVPVVSYQGGPSQQDRQAAGATERATVYRPTPNFEPIHSFHSRPTDRVSYSADPRNGEIDPYLLEPYALCIQGGPSLDHSSSRFSLIRDSFINHE